eukprot:g639.t1
MDFQLQSIISDASKVCLRLHNDVASGEALRLLASTSEAILAESPSKREKKHSGDDLAVKGIIVCISNVLRDLPERYLGLLQNTKEFSSLADNEYETNVHFIKLKKHLTNCAISAARSVRAIGMINGHNKRSFAKQKGLQYLLQLLQYSLGSENHACSIVFCSHDVHLHCLRALCALALDQEVRELQIWRRLPSQQYQSHPQTHDESDNFHINGIGIVIASMGRFRESKEIQAAACNLLLVIALAEINRKYLLRQKAITMAFHALTEYESDLEIALHVVGVIFFLSLDLDTSLIGNDVDGDSPFSQMILDIQTAEDTLLEALTRHFDSTEIVSQSISALNALLINIDCFTYFLQCKDGTGLPILINAIRSHYSSSYTLPFEAMGLLKVVATYIPLLEDKSIITPYLSEIRDVVAQIRESNSITSINPDIVEEDMERKMTALVSNADEILRVLTELENDRSGLPLNSSTGSGVNDSLNADTSRGEINLEMLEDISSDNSKAEQLRQQQHRLEDTSLLKSVQLENRKLDQELKKAKSIIEESERKRIASIAEMNEYTAQLEQQLDEAYGKLMEEQEKTKVSQEQLHRHNQAIKFFSEKLQSEKQKLRQQKQAETNLRNQASTEAIAVVRALTATKKRKVNELEEKLKATQEKVDWLNMKYLDAVRQQQVGSRESESNRNDRMQMDLSLAGSQESNDNTVDARSISYKNIESKSVPVRENGDNENLPFFAMDDTESTANEMGEDKLTRLLRASSSSDKRTVKTALQESFDIEAEISKVDYQQHHPPPPQGISENTEQRRNASSTKKQGNKHHQNGTKKSVKVSMYSHPLIMQMGPDFHKILKYDRKALYDIFSHYSERLTPSSGNRNRSSSKSKASSIYDVKTINFEQCFRFARDFSFVPTLLGRTSLQRLFDETILLVKTTAKHQYHSQPFAYQDQDPQLKKRLSRSYDKTTRNTMRPSSSSSILVRNSSSVALTSSSVASSSSNETMNFIGFLVLLTKIATEEFKPIGARILTSDGYDHDIGDSREPFFGNSTADPPFLSITDEASELHDHHHDRTKSNDDTVNHNHRDNDKSNSNNNNNNRNSLFTSHAHIPHQFQKLLRLMDASNGKQKIRKSSNNMQTIRSFRSWTRL